MKKYDAMKVESGGRTLVEEIYFDENDTVKWYDSNEQFSTAYNPTMTAAEFEWKQLGGSVGIHGRDRRINSGPEGVIKLLSSRFKALEITLENEMNEGILSDGSANGGKQIGGLASLISKTPTTGTVGGINRATSTNAFWRNYKYQPSADGFGAATSAANIKQLYTKALINLTRGNDKPKMVLAGNTHYEMLMTALQAQQQFVDESYAKAGFTNVVYQGVPVVLGGGVSFSGQSLVQADLSYFINTKYLHLVEHKDARFDPLEEVQSINQDAIVQLVVWMGNMTISNCKLQGVVFDS